MVPILILEEIRRVTDAAQLPAFWAVVCLQGLWWAGGTHESRRDSSNRCMKVLSGLLGLGCIRVDGPQPRLYSSVPAGVRPFTERSG